MVLFRCKIFECAVKEKPFDLVEGRSKDGALCNVFECVVEEELFDFVERSEGSCSLNAIPLNV